MSNIKTDTSYSLVLTSTSETEDLSLDNAYNEEEEITQRVPYTSLKNTYDFNKGLVFNHRILLLKCKVGYEAYYAQNIYEALLQMETNKYWLGVPLKNQEMGPLRWDKDIWDKIYDFEVALNLKTNY